ncbi:MAG TPA: hypothetical protein VFA89_21020 [Terriglobales bacterium]|nr:hypothetical protein [Terriglobales bacterium]
MQPFEVSATVVGSQNRQLFTTFNCPLCGKPNKEDSFTVDELRTGARCGLQGCYEDGCPGGRIMVVLEKQ